MRALPPAVRKELAPLLRLALPLAAAQGGQALMNVVDTLVVGRAGAVPLAGTGLGTALFTMFTVLGMGVMTGLDPLVAQAFGAGDAVRARRLLWQGAWLACAVAAVLAVPIAFVPGALAPLGIPEDVARQAGRHLLWRLPGLPFLLLYVGGRAYLQGTGRVRAVVVATAVANLINVPADLLFVFGGAALPAWTGPLRAVPAMGAGGAGIATSFASAAQAAIVALAAGAIPLQGGGSGLRRPRARDLRVALRVGLPVGLHMLAEVAIFAMVGFLAGRLGAGPLAAHQVAISVATFTFTIAVGLGNGASVRVGWAVGSRDGAGVRRAGLVALGAGAGFMSFSALALTVLAGPIARAFSGDPMVVAAAVPLLRVAALFQISDGIQAVGAGVLRGAGETRFTFAANILGHWGLGFPCAVALGLGAGMGVTGLWWGFVIGLSAVAVALLLRFVRISSRQILPLEEGEAAGG